MLEAVRVAFSRLGSALRLSDVDDDFQKELESHIELMTEENIARGMSPAEARRQARIRLGGTTQLRETNRQMWGVPFLESTMQDLRYAWRVLRKSPGFSITAVLTLALAIGANSVVFGVINGFILHPLNLPEAENVYQLERGNEKESVQSYPDYVDLRDRNHSFEGIAAYDITALAIDVNGNPSRVWAEGTTGNYFDVLRIKPYAGRFFHASDEHGPDSAPYVVLSYPYWQNGFRGDRGVLGHTVQVNKHPFTVIGVAPPDFHGTLMIFHPDIYMPLTNQQVWVGENKLNDRSSRWMFATVGRLKSGVTRDQAIADLNAIGADLEKAYPKEDGHMTFALARPGLYGDYLGPVVQGFLMGLMLLAGLILLAACANLGSLFASRAAERSREVALRLAVGANRMRILRQLFTESVLVSLIGGAVGVWASSMLLDWLSHWEPFPLWPLHVPVHPDTNVYLLALLLSVISGFLFGAVPVRQVLRTDPYEIVKSGTRTTAERRLTIRDVLLVVQIAICAVLVTSSVVAVRGLVRSLDADFGFEPEHKLLVETDLKMSGYTGDAAVSMQKRMSEAVASLPGVSSVGITDAPPMGPSSGSSEQVFSDASADLKPANALAQPTLIRISPEYLHAAETALLAGRTFTWHDDKNAPSVAVVNQQFARKIFGSVDKALGGYFKLQKGERIQVVGIVQDGKYGSLTEDPQIVMFFPMPQSPSTETFLVVRSNLDPQQLTSAIRRTLRGMDEGLPLTIETWNQAISPARFGARMAAMSLGVLGIMAAMLSITGIFGMAAYSISKRMKELGIRIALGATPKEVLQSALGRALRLLAWGSVAGLGLGILASRVLAAIVYQATPRDPVVLSAVVLAMLLLGLVATWIPAQRALSIDPLVLLREE